MLTNDVVLAYATALALPFFGYVLIRLFGGFR